MHWTLDLCCWLIVVPAWWLLHLLSPRHLIFSNILHKETVHLIQIPHLVMTGNCGSWSQVTSWYKTWWLGAFTRIFFRATWSHLHCCNSPWYFHKHGAVHVQYVLHGWGGVHALQLLESPKHIYMYFIDYCWLLFEQNLKILLNKLK
jgi:hypothetical protein